MVTSVTPTHRTDLQLGNQPLTNSNEVPNNLYQDLSLIYNALLILALQIDTKLNVTGDVTVNDNTKGFVLKDTQATPHYWRITVSVVGALVVTDLGTVEP